MIEESKEKAMKDLGPVTIENAGERFKQIEELSKKIMGKDFDIESKLTAIRKKLSGVNWSIVDATTEGKINNAKIQLEAIVAVMTSLTAIAQTTNLAGQELDKLKDIKSFERALGVGDKPGVLSNALNKVTEHFSKVQKDPIDAAIIVLASVKSLFEATKETLTEFKSTDDLAAGISAVNMAKAFKFDGFVASAIANLIGTFGTGAYTADEFTPVIDAASKANEALGNVKDIMETLKEVNARAAELNQAGPDNFIKTMKSSLNATLDACSDMVRVAQDLENALDMVGKINISSKLDSVAKGIGANGLYTIKGKELRIDVNFEIYLDPMKVESAIVTKKQSIIRDRLNYLNDNSSVKEKGPGRLYTGTVPGVANNNKY